MSQLVDRWGIETALAFLMIKLLQCAKRIFKPQEDGWRRAASAYLSSEHGKFGFGCFGVKPLEEARGTPGYDAHSTLALRLSEFLKGYPVSYVTLEWRLISVTLGKKQTCDILLSEYASDGSAVSFQPFLDGESGLSAEQEHEVLDLILAAYNATKELPDRARPRRLRKAAMRGVRRSIRSVPDRERAAAYIDRVLRSVSVCVGSLGRENTFQDPEITLMRPLGFSPIQFVIRCDFSANDADFWVYCNHYAEDGVPVMAMLDDLKRQWGESRPILYPGSGFATKSVRCSSVDDSVRHIALYLDFSRFFAERKRLAQAYDVEIPILALLSWDVAIHPVFAKFKFTLPLTIGASGRRARSLGLIYICPSKYCDDAAPERGFLNYLAAFNRLLDETKGRRSASYEMMEALAIAPPFAYRLTLALMPKAMESICGTAALSVVRNAGFIVGTMSDVAPDGFVAFGSLNLPSQDGGSVGAVSIKCRPEKIEPYANALREVLG
jgi:hypothetical protein